MKTKKLSFYALGAALVLTAASCSNDLPELNQGETYNGPTDTHYLKLNIVSGNGTSTRAGETYTDESDTNDNGDGAQYQDGNSIENAVNNLRIYFFDENGDAADVVNKSDVMSSYLDFNKNDLETALTPEDDNIEKTISPVLMISTARGDELPYSVVAVLNVPQELGEVASIDELNTKVNNFTVVATGADDDPGFVMSNSIYANGTKVMEDVEVTNHMFNTQAEAMEHPVTIYVERVNAKVEVTLDNDLKEDALSEGTHTLYPTGVKYKYTTPAVEGETDDMIYVEFLGWNTTCNTNESYLMKHIDPAWTNAQIMGNATWFDWNSPTRFRSFWAYNPGLTYNPVLGDAEGNNYLYGNFDDAQTIKGFGAIEGVKNYTYIQENAGVSGANPKTAYPTQLIVAGRLCNSKGTAITLAEYGGQQFTLDGLKTQMAGMSNIYVKQDNSWVKITGDNIEFVTATQAGVTSTTTTGGVKVPDPTKDGRYYVYANLVAENEDGEAYEYGQPNEETGVVTALSNISVGNAWLINHIKHAKVWETGSTYYYINIRHLGLYDSAMEEDPSTAKPATWGIVRNHIYQLNLSSIVGLGTPVYDPDEVIYPEHPNEDETFIAAKINILNWRLVPQNVSFVW